jgi:hypothetical protein
LYVDHFSLRFPLLTQGDDVTDLEYYALTGFRRRCRLRLLHEIAETLVSVTNSFLAGAALADLLYDMFDILSGLDDDLLSLLLRLLVEFRFGFS